MEIEMYNECNSLTSGHKVILKLKKIFLCITSKKFLRKNINFITLEVNPRYQMKLHVIHGTKFLRGGPYPSTHDTLNVFLAPPIERGFKNVNMLRKKRSKMSWERNISINLINFFFFFFWFGLVWFYGMSTIVGYIMPNPLYKYKLNI